MKCKLTQIGFVTWQITIQLKKEEQDLMGEVGQVDRWGMSACVVGKKMNISDKGSVREQRY